MLCGGSFSHHVKFSSFIFIPRIFRRVVFVKDKHPWISHVRSFFAPYKFSQSIASNSDVSGPSLLTRLRNRAVRKLELASRSPVLTASWVLLSRWSVRVQILDHACK